MVVNLVKQSAAEELVTKLKSGKTISIDQVVRESKRSSICRYIYNAKI